MTTDPILQNKVTFTKNLDYRGIAKMSTSAYKPGENWGTEPQGTINVQTFAHEKVSRDEQGGYY